MQIPTKFIVLFHFIHRNLLQKLMEPPRNLHGTSMEPPWNLHGISMKSGGYMEVTWRFHGGLMQIPIKVIVKFIVYGEVLISFRSG